MIKIKKVRIRTFRSIMDLILKIDENNNYITICGENNVGKTNILKALNLFFNPDCFNQNKDRPYSKILTGGSRTDPTINIDFIDTRDNTLFQIEREFNQKNSSQFIAG